MKRLLLLSFFFIFIFSCRHVAPTIFVPDLPDYETAGDATYVVKNGVDNSVDNNWHYIDLIQPTDEQRKEVRAEMVTYFEAILASKVKFEQESTDRDEYRLERTTAFYEYHESLKNILSESQWSDYQKRHYFVRMEKDIKTYLRKNGYLKS